MNPIVVKWLLFAAAVALCAGLGYGVVSTYRGAIQRAQKAEQQLEGLRSEVKYLREARRKERETASLDAKATAKLITENENARTEIETLRGRLATGTLRVRDRFTCPTAGVPGATGSAAGSDATGERGLRSPDADFLIRLAGEADAIARRLALCQDALTRR